MKPTDRAVEKLARWLHRVNAKVGYTTCKRWEFAAEVERNCYRSEARALLTKPPAVLVEACREALRRRREREILK